MAKSEALRHANEEAERLKRSNAVLLEACKSASTTIEAMMYRAKNENRARDYWYLSDRFECVRAAIEAAEGEENG